MKEFLNRFNLTLIIFTYCALVLALYSQLNIFIVLLGIGCAIWRCAHYIGRIKLLHHLVLSCVAIIATLFTVLLLYQQGLFIVLIHLVFLGFSLKFLELRAVRDVYFFVNTGFVLTALFFIFNTSLASAFIALILLLLLLAILLSLHAHNLLKKDFVLLLFKSFLISLPLAFLLFIVMPRLPSLWKMPIQKQATTGLSDSVSPGEIAKLSRSSALAFRATFKGEIPPEQARYWRAMTLDNFDGKSWTQSHKKKRQESQARRGLGLRFQATQHKLKTNSEYELIIEPHYNYWLPVLDYALTPKGLVSLQDYSLRSNVPIIARKTFTIAQTNRLSDSRLTPKETAQLTQLPSLDNHIANNKTEQWITEHLNAGKSKQKILTLLLNRFASDFTYTLQPPLLGDNQIDDFLFNTQAGFCVHYASSYLYVARRLGIPARMVTGYLGGEWQASEGFFTVRQYDAHAWVEIWHNERWQRIDPTAHVSPERVDSGLEAGLTDNNEFLADEYFSLQKWQSNPLLNQLRLRFAQIDYLWARYVVNFDNQKQIRLLQYWITKLPWLNISYAVLTLMMAIFGLLVISIFKPWQKQSIAPEEKLYATLQKQFIKRDITRENGQTVSEYCELVTKQYPLAQQLMNTFSKRYNQIKYQPNLSSAHRKKYLKQLKMIINQLKKYY